jgi:hypothetical protein
MNLEKKPTGTRHYQMARCFSPTKSEGEAPIHLISHSHIKTMLNNLVAVKNFD